MDYELEMNGGGGEIDNNYELLQRAGYVSDPVMMMAEKKGKTRPDRPFLTPRCKYVLNYLADQTILRLDQVQKLMGRMPGKQTKQYGLVSAATAMRRLRLWEKKGMLIYERPFTDEPGYAFLTSHGLNHCFEDYTYLRPARGKYTHFRLVTEVRMDLENRHGPNIAIRSERLLRKLYHVPKGAFKQRAKDEAAGQSPHIPDMEVVKREDGGVAAVEVELSLKGPQRLQEILTELSERYATIYYYLVPKTQAFVQEQLAKLPEPVQARFEIRDLLSLVADLEQNPFVW